MWRYAGHVASNACPVPLQMLGVGAERIPGALNTAASPNYRYSCKPSIFNFCDNPSLPLLLPFGIHGAAQTRKAGRVSPAGLKPFTCAVRDQVDLTIFSTTFLA